ncbi:hypothetical protein ABTX85_37430 [Streptomyces sp. NPDC096097]|uniref:hypothetical protein n=1 Tax=Streptomyces sp. NPDC096097 TaxID=3155546 RepID=UPI00332F328C
MARERIRWPLVVERARQIVDGYAPLKVTLRQVMYRLAAEGVLPHTPPMYWRLFSRLARPRREGGFLDLIDTVSEVHVPPAWPGASVAEMPGWFRLGRTKGRKHAVYVAAEDDTLRQQRPAGSSSRTSPCVWSACRVQGVRGPGGRSAAR